MKAIRVLSAGLAIFLCLGTIYAQEEEITISTYYPAPYGEYEELYTNYMDFNNNAYHETPTDTMPPAREGRICYDTTTNEFKYSPDGTSWSPLGGVGVGEVDFGTINDTSGGSASGTYAINTQYTTTKAGFVVFMVQVDNNDGFARYIGGISPDGGATWEQMARAQAVGTGYFGNPEGIIDNPDGGPDFRAGYGSLCMPVPKGWTWRVQSMAPHLNVGSEVVKWVPFE